MRYRIPLPVIILTIACAPGAAQTDIQSKAFEYPYDVYVYDLPVASNGVKYRLYVRPPLREPGQGEKSASFYFLDAIANFVPAAAMTFNYEHFNYLPAAYHVGIGYQDEADGVAKEHNRTRDYTPTEFAPPDDNHFLAASPASYEGSGGANAFLDVVENEIIPFIESQYDVDRDERVLIGNSLSGLAAVHSLLTRPGLFQRYVIVSPSIWWDDWLDARDERYVMNTAQQTRNQAYPAETRAYFAVGDAEERLGMVTDLYVLTNALKSRRDENLKVHLEVLDDEIHEGVFPAAFMRGIVGLYAGDPDRRESATRVRW
jgi:predicted alpha/beta superfamily hydrolase